MISLNFEKMKKYIEEWDESCTILKNILSIRTFEELVLSQDQGDKNLHEFVEKRIDLMES